MKFYWSALTIDGIRVLFDGKAPDEQIDIQLFLPVHLKDG